MALKRFLLLSGAIGSGKSSVASELKSSHNFSGISSSEYLRAYGQRQGEKNRRQQMQDLGDRLDSETDFTWIVREVAVPTIEMNSNIENWLLDAVRKPRQIAHFRSAFGDLVQHVHLSALENVLRSRYESRVAPGDSSYTEAIQHPNEMAARSLGLIADHTFDTTSTSAKDIAAQIFHFWKG